MAGERDGEGTLVVSYLILRQTIGILGFALPFVLMIGGALLFGAALQPSMSDYYYTGMRDVFVGILCAIGAFLLSYRGYEPADAVAGKVAFVCATGVALFPTTPADATHRQAVVGAFHYVFAAGFFLTLAYFSLFLFTKTNPDLPPTRRKRQRNAVYRTCGFMMLVAIALIALLHVLPTDALDGLREHEPVLWLEATAVVAFGVSWLVKGEAILKDLP